MNVWTGFCSVTVGEPSAKFQAHEVGLPVEFPLNWTVNGAHPSVTSAVIVVTVIFEGLLTVIVATCEVIYL